MIKLPGFFIHSILTVPLHAPYPHIPDTRERMWKELFFLRFSVCFLMASPSALRSHTLCSRVGNGRENLFRAESKDVFGDSPSSAQIRNEISNRQNNPQRGHSETSLSPHLVQPRSGCPTCPGRAPSESHCKSSRKDICMKSETLPAGNTHCCFMYHKEISDAADEATRVCLSHHL